MKFSPGDRSGFSHGVFVNGNAVKISGADTTLIVRVDIKVSDNNCILGL